MKKTVVCDPSLIQAKSKSRGKVHNNGYGYGLHSAGYGGTNSTWYSKSGSARLDVDDNLPKLRQRSRDLYMSSSLISSILLTLRDGTIGRGLRLNAEIDSASLGLSLAQASRWEQLTASKFKRWSESCGISGESLDDVVRLAFFSALLSGDSFIHVTLDPFPRLQVLEGDRIQTPPTKAADSTVRHGVKFSKKGRVIGYYVTMAHPADSQNVDYTYIRAFGAGGGLIHVHVPFERPDQTRGIPLLSRVMDSAKLLDRYIDAESTAAVVASKFTVFVKHPVDEVDDWNETEQEQPTPIPPKPLALGDGAVVDLYGGEDIQTANPNRPAGVFSAFVEALQKQICAALGMPLDVVLRAFNSSYSASRAAILDADRTYRIYRRQLEHDVLNPIYRLWLHLAVSFGLVEADGFSERPYLWDGASWFSDAIPSIDPTKEADAAEKRIKAGLTTYAREAEELTGMDYQTLIRQLAFEEAQRRQYLLNTDNNGIPVQIADDPVMREEG